MLINNKYLNTFFFYFYFFLYFFSTFRNKNFYIPKKIKKTIPIFFKDIVKKKIQQKNINILIDDFTNLNWQFINYLFLKYLSTKSNLNINSFSIFQSLEIKKLFKIIGVKYKFIFLNNLENFFFLKEIFYSLCISVKSKKDLLNYSCDNINFGIDIYETILRGGNHTFNINSLKNFKFFFLFSVYYSFYKNYFEKNKVDFVLISHDNYIEYNVLAKISRFYDSKVLLIGPKGIVKSDSSFSQFKIFEKYAFYKKKFFNKTFYKKLKRKAKKNLSKRLNLGINIDIPYQTLSPFHNNKHSKQILSKNNFNIMIAAHCFYDNPHSYSKLQYSDFWEWLIYLGKISKKSPENFKWYIKSHRDFLPGTPKVLNSFIKLFPNIKIIDPRTSFHQLKQEGLDLVITCYGTVAHEVPLLGIEAINCDYNPSIKFKFSKTILNKKSLENYIYSQKKIKKFYIKKDIFDFYALHYLYFGDNNFWKEFTKANPLEDFSFLKNYEDFQKKQKFIFIKIRKFLSSRFINSQEFFNV
jgi:hypothetical protein